MYNLQLKKFLPVIFSPPESKVDFTTLDSLENILLKQPAQEASCILNDKVHLFFFLFISSPGEFSTSLRNYNTIIQSLGKGCMAL